MVLKKLLGLTSLILCVISISGMQNQPQQTSQQTPQQTSVTPLPQNLNLASASTIPQAQAIVQNFINNYRGLLIRQYDDLRQNPQLVDALTYAIKTKNIANLRDLFFQYFNETYGLITLFIQQGKSDLLSTLFTLVKSNNIPWDLNRVPPRSSSLLVLAYKQYKITKNLDIVKLLLQHGASIRPFVIHNDGAFVDLLLKNGARLDLPANGMLLHDAAVRNFITIAELLLQHKVYINISDSYGRTIIRDPVIKGYYQMIKLLQSYKVPPFVPNGPQEALVRAVESNDIKAVQEWLHYTSPQNEKDLIKAVQEKNTKTMNLLIEQRLSGNGINEKGEHLLTIAARNDNPALVALLVHFGKTNLQYLVEQGDSDTVQYVLNCLPCHFSLDEANFLLEKAETLKNNAMITFLEGYIKKMGQHIQKGKPLPGYYNAPGERTKKLIFKAETPDEEFKTATLQLAKFEYGIQKGEIKENEISLPQSTHPGPRAAIHAAPIVPNQETLSAQSNTPTSTITTQTIISTTPSLNEMQHPLRPLHHSGEHNGLCNNWFQHISIKHLATESPNV